MKGSARAVPVLMYHHISSSPGMITVTPGHFAAQMAYLASAGYRTLGSRHFRPFSQGSLCPQSRSS